MLSEQTAISETLSEAIPMGFLTTEDGRTLLAVSERSNGILEIMTTPVTFIQQSDAVTPTFIKTMDGNLILHSPVFQVSVENVSGNAIQQATVIPVQALDTSPILLGEVTSERDKETPMETIDLASDNLRIENILLNKNHEDSSSDLRTSNESKSRYKRSPGRPKKNGTISQNTGDLKCDVCGENFTKHSLFRKHMEQHAEEKPHRCPKCPASFNIPSNFTLHMATHNIGEPKCPECGRKFARMASLKSHMLLHEKEENLFCTECEDAFSTRAQLDAHLKLHGEKWATEDVRKCKLCNKQFAQPALYRLHIREHYRLQTKIVKQTKRGTKHKTVYKCTICLKSFQKPSQLMRHIRVHTGEKPFKCATCGRAFTQKGSLQIHMWQHNGIRPHICNLCNAKFSQKGNLNAHVLRVHNVPEGEPIYGCTHCSCVFKKLGSLNGHMKRMHSSPTEESNGNGNVSGGDGCGTSKSESSVEADMRATVDSVISQLASLESESESVRRTNVPTDTGNAETSVPPEKDDILQRALENSGLPSEQKDSANESPQDSSKESGAKTSYVTLLDRAPDGSMRKYLTIKQRCIGNVRWYACSFCHKEFKKPSDLIRHLRVHTQEKPFKCSYCFRSFALKSTMIAHERTHTGAKKYACGSCEKTFACHSSLSAHTRLHAKPHKCTVCDKSFGASTVLKSHMKIHARGKSKVSPEVEVLVPQIVLQEPLVISDAGNKISVAHVQSKQGQIYNDEDVARPHKCWVCHAAFRKISHLKQHYRRHTGERPYKCTKCERRFTSNSVLKSHLHTHDDSRPYSCSVCNTKFSTQSSMKRHLVTHSNKRPFMCPYCHKTFKTSVNCRKHMKIHKQELAQQQLEQQKSQKQMSQERLAEQKEPISTLSENLSLSEDMEVSFQPQMAPDFAQAFSDQFQSLTEEKEKSFLSPDNPSTHSIVSQSLPEVRTSDLPSSQTLHADETGTITLPNYSGEQTLTAESIREIEETLNQQLFNIGMNLGLGGNLSRQIDEGTANSLESREQPILNIIYDHNKSMDSSGNTIFTSHFDSFDMNMAQITLQDAEIDIGLNSPSSSSMSSILPKSVQEAERLVPPLPVSTTSNVDENRIKPANPVIAGHLERNSNELPELVKTTSKYSKIVAKADTTDGNIDVSCTGVHEKKSNNVSCEIATTSLPFPIKGLKLEANLCDVSGANNSGATPAVSISQSDSLLQCHMCNERDFTTEGLKEHLKTHRGSKEYQCTECSLRFCTNGGLSRHLKIHTSKQQWKCSTCHKILNSKTQLKLHKRLHENTWNGENVGPDSSQRDTCSINGSLPAAVTSNGSGRLSLDSSVSEKVLLDTVAEKKIMENNGPDQDCGEREVKEYTNRCKYCPKTFRKPSDLIRHVRTHTGERPYKCDYCNKSFAVKCTLDSHRKVHTGKKTFCCHVCSSLFATKGSLKVHMRLHTGSKPFRCPICELRFRTSGHRKVHLLKHVREHKGGSKRKQKYLKVTAVAEATADMEKAVERMHRDVPIEPAAQQETIEYHNLDTLGIDANGPPNQISFSADATTILNNNSVLSINENNQLVANLHFLLTNGLVTIQTDDGLLQQPVVAADLNSVSEMATSTLEVPCTKYEDGNTNHIVISNQMPASSTYQAAASAAEQLQYSNCVSVIQVEQVNDTKSSLPPSLPPPPPPPPPSLQPGRQVKKSQSKKECDICGKTFTKPYQVERHKRIHTGERPYKCDLCTKSFAQKSTLQMHQKHHTGDRPHPCPHCEYSFTQKGNLQTHLRRVHRLNTVENKKLRRGQPVLNVKLPQESLTDAKILNLDDISFVELLK